MRSIGQEGRDIAIGLGVVEAGPDLLKSGMKDIFGSSNFGSDVSNTEFGKIAGNTLDFAQGIAPPVAILGFTYLGLKLMTKGIFENPGKRRAY